MTYENFIQFIKKPDSITESDQLVLKELASKYPYFGLAKWLYLKSLQVSNSIYFEKELARTAVYAPSRRQLYFFIHPEPVAANEAAAKVRNESSGSYFDMIRMLEKREENKSGSLQSLAEKLKAAREIQNSKPKETVLAHTPVVLDYFSSETETQSTNAGFNEVEILESDAKELIREKKYDEAIQILEKLYLINPKKSIYFADQIRFLKKITKK